MLYKALYVYCSILLSEKMVTLMVVAERYDDINRNKIK